MLIIPISNINPIVINDSIFADSSRKTIESNIHNTINKIIKFFDKHELTNSWGCTQQLINFITELFIKKTILFRK